MKDGKLGLSDIYKFIAWDRAEIFSGLNPLLWRVDPYRSLIYWNDYGDTNSDYGWEIDHVWPKASGGADHPRNHQALHWRNNRAKGAKLPIG
jgi:hypothetical protein